MKWSRRKMGDKGLNAWLPVNEETPSPEGFVAMNMADAVWHYFQTDTYGIWPTGMPYSDSVAGSAMWMGNPHSNSQEPYDTEWEGETPEQYQRGGEDSEPHKLLPVV